MPKKRSISPEIVNSHHNFIHKHEKHPVLRQQLSLGQRVSDIISQFGGSWKFIFFFFLFLAVWISINIWFLINRPFDPYPFILLNLILSTLAAVQAPIILMSQNRFAERDRIQAHYDYMVNRKAEREIHDVQKDLEEIKQLIRKKK